MAELEQLGLAGPAVLREILTTCSDPIDAIQTFQRDNCLQMVSLHPALRLLDLHGIRRAEYHESVLTELQQKLTERIQTLGTAGSKEDVRSIQKLLEKSFPLIGMSFIRPIVLECLRRLPKIPEKHLKAIAGDSQLYKDCDVGVKQQIWLLREDLFKEEVQPQIDGYLAGKLALLRNLETPHAALLRASGKQRRQSPHIQSLVKILGDHVDLYDRVLGYIRSGHAATHSPFYCSLRFDLLMALHDADVKPLIELDPCHSFAWCLDPCVRDKHLDLKHATELKTFLDRKREPGVWGDVALVAADPAIAHFFSSLVLKVLSQGVTGETLPRDLGSLVLVMRLVELGAEAGRVQGDGRVEPLLFTKFLPALMSVLADDHLRHEVSRLEPHTEFPLGEETGPSKLLVDFLKTESVCASVWMAYVVSVISRGDREAVARAVPLLARAKDRIAYSEPFLHILISKLISFSGTKGPDGAPWCSCEEFCCLFLDQYLLKGDGDAMKWHLLRLVYHLGLRLPETRVQALLSSLDPVYLEQETDTQVSDEYGAAYAKVQQRVAAARADAEEANNAQPFPIPTLTDQP